MRLTTVVLIGMVLLGPIILRSASSAGAQEPIKTRTLFEARIDLPAERPLCWDVRQGSLAPGAKAPPTGFHTHGWVVAFVTGGAERVAYEAGGTPATVSAGQAGLFAAGSPHVHESIGDTPRTNIGFEMSCSRLSGSLANTGALPGIRTGQVSYSIQARERVWPPDSQTPVHILSGPTATYIVEGTIARSTAAGITHSGPGELYVSPVGELAQNSNIGGTPARTLDVDLWPAGETRSVAQPPEVRLPSPFVTTLPRTGDGGLLPMSAAERPWGLPAAVAGLSLLGLGMAIKWLLRDHRTDHP